MDAHVFRALAARLAPVLVGARLGKAFLPAPDFWSLTLSSRSLGKAVLLFRPALHGKSLLLCLTPAKPENPAAPPAQAMWLRKRVANRVVTGIAADWPSRRLALALGGGYLLLDAARGPDVAERLPDGFGQEPGWPPLTEALGDPEVWRRYPHVSPALRKALRAMPADEAARVYGRLALGPAEELFLSADAPPDIAAWPFPEGRAAADAPADVLGAARAYAEPRFHAGLCAAEEGGQAKELRARHKRLTRTLERLRQDRERLAAMAALQDQAEALQAYLYRLGGAPLSDSMTLEHPAKGPLRVALNPTLSATDNMRLLFAKAAKGKRGLAAVAAREGELRAGLEAQPAAAPSGRPEAADGAAGTEPRPLPARYKGLAVGVFVTSDGFTALRGKSAQANHQLLSVASPFDYWFHAAERPGAHVILRRDHPGHEVPERSLEEAAVLAGLASGYAGEAKADVHAALVRDVRKVKGAAAGLVRVEQVWRTLRVALDPDTPQRLAYGA